MDYLFGKYPNHLSLDVSTDNIRAFNFYKRVGLDVANVYLSEDKVEFANFKTPEGFIPPQRLSTLSIESSCSVTSEELKVGDVLGGFISLSPTKRSESDDDTLVSEGDSSEINQMAMKLEDMKCCSITCSDLAGIVNEIESIESDQLI